MQLAFTAEQEALKAELRSYFASLVEEIEADTSDESSYTSGAVIPCDGGLAAYR